MLNVLNGIKVIHCCCVFVMFLLLMLFDKGWVVLLLFYFSEEKQSLRFTIFKSAQIHLNALSLRKFY